ncbi:KaiC-like protein 2 [Rhodovastum atsumiense]|uniref:non-specific serine/threonine protein kinase n=1 Tax=Rhodovastum atsumiense TaxID=504468 RepID=A0A5M6IZY6_9PROT|nr:circadian clock protein KaiC [Rhodovastum atsumiense]KAA5613910.1 circadian clock protein KaiC [Rhodovastum atsumiense]CAH2602040.1 KaiC-like protein 2 [Rhodovastum atsumiense]
MIIKVPSHIPGFDHIADGGLPLGRTTMVSGTAGSAKTILAAQFLAEGIRKAHEPGVFVTFEETAEDLRRNMLGFGWDIAAWEEAGLWAFVDASPEPTWEPVVAGDYDLGALLARIEHATQRVRAQRLAMDSLGAALTRFGEASMLRREMLRIITAFKRLGLTTLLTTERRNEYGRIARCGVEEFVADNVIILRNVLEGEKRRRTLEILKFRGTPHHKGEYPLTIINGEGIVVIPLSAIELKQRSSDVRITSGNADMDAMCGGGFFRDSILLVSGATGTGKTLMATEFMAGGIGLGERCLLFAFEESREQLFRNARGWGIDFEGMEREGRLRVICAYPENEALEDHLLRMKRTIEEFGPQRVAVDSFSALERVSGPRGFREFVIGLTSFIKQQEIAGLFTAATSHLMGGESVTQSHISTITDLIILLRYVEIYGEMRRGLTVLKMRGSRHDKDIREFTIDGNGMHIGKAFREVTGILTGSPRHASSGEIEIIRNLFGRE